MTTVLDVALELATQGLSVIPVASDKTKRPAVAWKQYQAKPATEEQIRAWFTNTPHQLGVITGEVSRNLLMFEIEGAHKHLLTELHKNAVTSGHQDLWARLNTGWVEQSPSSGLHWFAYLDHETPGNAKLASTAERETIAETRGRGGFAVVAPSSGAAHPTGNPWTRITGGPTNAPTLTRDDYEALEVIFRTLDRARPATPVSPAEQHYQQPNSDNSQAPGTHFDQQTSWADILTPHGWQIHHTSGRTTYWTRPGKKPADGFSATTGHAEDRDRLYVFTTSTEFDAETPYTKFGAHTLLTTGGESPDDFVKAAKKLRAEGFGVEANTPVLSAEDREARAAARAQDAADFADLTQNIPSWGRNTENHPRTTSNQTNPGPPAEKGTDTHTGGSGAQNGTHGLHDVNQESAQEPGPAAPTEGELIHNTTEGALATVTELRPRELTILEMSDDGNATALINEYGNRLRYCTDRGRWLAWNGHTWDWQPASGGRAREYAKDIGRALPNSNDYAAHKRRTLSAKGTTDMLTQAATDPRVTITQDQLDAHPWELNTPAGILDLTTGKLTPANPARLHTRTTRHAPNPNADPTLWDTFLTDTFNDAELTAYMQRLIGYSVVGQVREHILPFAHGSGGNGKGVFLEALMQVLGDYATTSPNGFLMATNYAAHTTEIARLSGARMVLCSEVNETDRFDEAKVKLLTGGDTLTARYMRQDDFTFTPTHQLWLMGNHKPAVHSGGRSFWRRLRLIPFEHEVPEHQIIDGLQDILATDHGEALMNWIAAGAAAYHQHGLQAPGSVGEATKQYAADVDTVGRFLTEETTLHPDYTDRIEFSTPTGRLRAAYETWCHDNGETPVKGRTFTTQLAQHGVATGTDAPRTKLSKHYGGVTLLTSQEELTDYQDPDPWRD